MNRDRPHSDRNAAGGFSLRFFLLILLAAASLTLLLVGGNDFYATSLETDPPEIQLIEPPRGVGEVPVTIRFELTDRGAGLDEVVIRMRQKKSSSEILRLSLDGAHSKILSYEFIGEESGVQTGVVDLEVRAFDRSFWNNQSEELFAFKVDFRRPRVEVLTSQHNARHGGSQLVFYKAIDEDLADSGVRVGSQFFLGFPARGLDREFDDPNLFVAVYAADLRTPVQQLPVKVFAVDQVGNAASAGFYNKVLPRSRRAVVTNLDDEFLRYTVPRLAEQNADKLKQLLGSKQLPQVDSGSKVASDEAIIETFALVNEKLREINDSEVSALLKRQSFESYWKRAFLLPQGSYQQAFGDQVTYRIAGQDTGRAFQAGYEVVMPRNVRDVYAANDGMVSFSENIGIYGRSVAIDHGLGVASLYGRLEQVLVRQGEHVTRGQKIAVVGNTGFARNTHLYFEMRVHGVPVDPVEWGDEGWFYTHIVNKIADMKKAFGIPVYRPFE